MAKASSPKLATEQSRLVARMLCPPKERRIGRSGESLCRSRPQVQCVFRAIAQGGRNSVRTTRRSWTEPMSPSREMTRLIEIMAALRTPGTGCPWDLAQNFATIGPYTLEEAYEVADAIARGDLADLREELGDLLLQVVFHARIAEEAGAFDFGAVVEAITAKLIRRHPHVFGEARGLDAEAVEALWEHIKSEEKATADRKTSHPVSSALAGILVN